MRRSLLSQLSATYGVRQHPGDYTPNDQDKAQAAAQNSLWVLGSVLAKIDLVCTMFDRRGCLLFLTAPRENQCLVTDVLLPGTQVSTAAAVDISGQAVIQANREARRVGNLIVGAVLCQAGRGESSGKNVFPGQTRVTHNDSRWSYDTNASVPHERSNITPRGVASPSPAFRPRLVTDRVAGLARAEPHPEHRPSVEPLRGTTLPKGSLLHIFQLVGGQFVPWYTTNDRSFAEIVDGTQTTAPPVLHVIGPETLDWRQRNSLLASAEQRMPRRARSWPIRMPWLTPRRVPDDRMNTHNTTQ